MRRTVSVLAPDRVFLVLALTFGSVSALLVPPFQVPDEPSQFYRAFRVSELRLLDRGNVLLPTSLVALVDLSGVRETRFHPDRKVTPAWRLGALRAPLAPQQREYVPASRYHAVAYLPQALGIAVGRLFGGSPLVLFYLGRLFALLGWATLVFLAIRTTPVLEWTYVLLALMPMTLFLAASYSVDAMVIGASFLLSATLLAWAYDPAKSRIGLADCAGLLALALVLALCKPLYLLPLFLLLLVPRAKFPSARGHRAILVTAALACALAPWLWESLTTWAAPPGPAIADPARHLVALPKDVDISAPRQLAFVATDPLEFFGVAAVSVVRLYTFYLESFVGILGWLDTRLPFWVPWVYLAALVLVSSRRARERVSWPAKGLALSVFALTVLGVLGGMYLHFTAVRGDHISGVQGRYFIPIAPLFFLAFSNRRARRPVTSGLVVVLIALMTATSVVSAYWVARRFY